MGILNFLVYHVYTLTTNKYYTEILFTMPIGTKTTKAPNTQTEMTIHY